MWKHKAISICSYHGFILILFDVIKNAIIEQNITIMKKILISILAVLATISMSAKTPLIGVSGYAETGSNKVNVTYTDAILAAGGAPVIVPVTTDDTAIEAIVAKLDGLLMSGGEDFDPLKWYGEEPLRALGEIAPVRDDFDVKLIRAAVKKGIPVLGICRGNQLTAIAFGGSLYQDIPSQVRESKIKHRQTGTPGSYGTHTINIEKGSFLEKALKSDKAVVNSFHHQAIKTPAPGFKVAATAPDGIVEAIERVAPLQGYPDGGGMIIGVQYHPEQLITGNDKSFIGIFELLVKEASK